jgi:hypothetical protein
MVDKPSHGFRKAPPPVVNPAAASAFVTLDDAPGATGLPPPAPPSLATAPVKLPDAPPPPPAELAPTQGRARRRKTLVRADGRELRKQTIYFDPDLSVRLAVYCAQTGKDLSEVVGVAVSHFLARSAGR